MLICVGPSDPDNLFTLDAISSWIMFSKMTSLFLFQG